MRDTYEKIQGMLKSYGLGAVMPFMVNGEEFTLQGLVDQLYGLATAEYEAGYRDGYDTAYLDWKEGKS
jgi:hypothetical protein